MAAFRLLNNFPVYMDNQGRPADGGYLLFFEAGTTTPKAVYADPGLTISNGARVDLLSSGRTEVDVWGSGSYRVRLYDSTDELLAEADDVEIAGGDGATIPALVDGYYLTNNGSLLLWAPILEVPDPTGQNGKVLTSDGTGVPVWVALQQAVQTITPGSSGSLKFSNGSQAILVQWGADSFPASGTTVADKLVTYPTAFTGTPYFVGISYNGSHGSVASGGLPATGTSSISATQFFANADTNGWKFINAVAGFQWMAIGPTSA